MKLKTLRLKVGMIMNLMKARTTPQMMNLKKTTMTKKIQTAVTDSKGVATSLYSLVTRSPQTFLRQLLNVNVNSFFSSKNWQCGQRAYFCFLFGKLWDMPSRQRNQLTPLVDDFAARQWLHVLRACPILQQVRASSHWRRRAVP